MELWTERQSTQFLQLPRIGRDAARSALKAGIAGPPIRVRGALLYPADRVREAAARTYEPCEIRARVDRPVFVARVAAREDDPASAWRSWRGADVLAPVAEQRDAARAWWHLGERMAALVRGVGRVKGMPFVVTCGGFVVLGAEVCDFDEELADEGVELSRARKSRARTDYTRLATAFVLADAGALFDDQLGRRWSTGPGGPFRLVHAPRSGADPRPSMSP